MDGWQFFVFAHASLFAVVDPLATVPLFLAMTPHDPPARRARMAAVASCVAAGILVFFALAGGAVFRFFGVTLPAFQVAGGIILFLIALDMLQARDSDRKLSPEEREEGGRREDVAISPLAVPLLAGPGAISTVLLLQSQAKGVAGHATVYLAVVVVCALTYLVLRLSCAGAAWLNPLAMRLITRLMSLLLAALAIQFIFNGAAAAAAAAGFGPGATPAPPAG